MVWIRRLKRLVLVCFLVAFGSVRCGASAPFFFIFCGDSRFGSDSSSDHPEILDQIVEEANIRKPAFFLYGGDGPDHNTAENYEAFKARLDRLTMPYYNVVGNHDIYVEATGGYSRDRHKELFGDLNYAFAHGKAYFIIVDSAGHGARPWGIKASVSDVDPWAWMVGQLEQHVPLYRHTFIVTHTPPYDAPPRTDHAFTDTTEAAEFVTLMAKSGVTVVLCSHEHLYYETEWEGVPYFISGGAGATLWPNGFYHYMEVYVGKEVTTRVIPVLGSIKVFLDLPSVGTPTVDVGGHRGFIAFGEDPTGHSIRIEPPMDRRWSSSHPEVGAIDPSTGVFQALSVGTTEVRMTSGLRSGTITVRVVEDSDSPGDSGMPGDFRLGQNVPNPFNDGTHISYYAPRTSRPRIAVYSDFGFRISDFGFFIPHSAIHNPQSRKGGNYVAEYTSWRGQSKYHPQRGSGQHGGLWTPQTSRGSRQ